MTYLDLFTDPDGLLDRYDGTLSLSQRHVRTPEGARIYGKPIGAVIQAHADDWHEKFEDHVNHNVDGAAIRLEKNKTTGHVHLAKISVDKNHRGKGLADDVMTDLVNEADKHGHTVTLDPSADYGSSKSRLIGWYKTHGFAENKGRNRDYEISADMHRAPVAPKKVEPQPVKTAAPIEPDTTELDDEDLEIPEGSKLGGKPMQDSNPDKTQDDEAPVPEVAENNEEPEEIKADTAAPKVDVASQPVKKRPVRDIKPGMMVKDNKGEWKTVKNVKRQGSSTNMGKYYNGYVLEMEDGSTITGYKDKALNHAETYETKADEAAPEIDPLTGKPKIKITQEELKARLAEAEKSRPKKAVPKGWTKGTGKIKLHGKERAVEIHHDGQDGYVEQPVAATIGNGSANYQGRMNIYADDHPMWDETRTVKIKDKAGKDTGETRVEKLYTKHQENAFTDENGKKWYHGGGVVVRNRLAGTTGWADEEGITNEAHQNRTEHGITAFGEAEKIDRNKKAPRADVSERYPEFLKPGDEVWHRGEYRKIAKIEGAGDERKFLDADGAEITLREEAQSSHDKNKDKYKGTFKNYLVQVRKPAGYDPKAKPPPRSTDRVTADDLKEGDTIWHEGEAKKIGKITSEVGQYEENKYTLHDEDGYAFAKVNGKNKYSAARAEIQRMKPGADPTAKAVAPKTGDEVLAPFPAQKDFDAEFKPPADASENARRSFFNNMTDKIKEVEAAKKGMSRKGAELDKVEAYVKQLRDYRDKVFKAAHASANLSHTPNLDKVLGLSSQQPKTSRLDKFLNL